jgi:hypothetical protein
VEYLVVVVFHQFPRGLVSLAFEGFPHPVKKGDGGCDDHKSAELEAALVNGQLPPLRWTPETGQVAKRDSGP